MIYMIGNAHLDPVWLWTKLDGYAEVISTFESAARRLEEDKDFIFTCSSAAYYEFVKRLDPVLFEKIRGYVKAGRWVVVGGWWIQPDNNLAAGEVYARHALYSQRFYAENFGVTCRTGYCVDSFGHNANMPQLLKKSGMNSYVFMRPEPKENAALPVLFDWRSVDGSEVTTYRITGQNYNNVNLTIDGTVRQYIESSAATGEDRMCFYGVGNHGGGPTRKNLAEINALIQKGLPVKYGDPDAFFEGVRSSGTALPVVTGPLHHHAVGCYSVCGRIKQAQREAESELQKAERLMLLAWRLAKYDYRGDMIEGAYKKVLFNTFHDILCGCSLKKGITDAMQSYGAALTAARTLKEEAMIALAKQIDTMVDGVTHEGKEDWQLWEEDNLGVPVVIFNTSAAELVRYVSVERGFATVLNESGSALPVQYTQSNFMNAPDDRTTVFKARVKPFGYTTYWLYKNNKLPAPPEAAPIAREFALENELLRVLFDAQTGGVLSVFDKANGREFLRGASFVPKIYADATNTWSHGINRYEFDPPREMRLQWLKVTENGGCLGEITAEFAIEGAKMTLSYRLYEGEAFVSVKAKVMYDIPSSVLRLEAAPSFAVGEGLFEMPYGFYAKRAEGDESPALRYGAAVSADQSAALALVTDCKSAFQATENKLSFTAVRSSVYAFYGGARDDEAVREFTDEGLSHFDFAIVPVTGAVNHASLTRIADNLADADCLIDTYHRGALSRAYSAMSVTADNIVLSAAKKGEDEGALVFRLYETDQRETDCDFIFENKRVKLHFAKNEVKTLVLRSGEFMQSDFMEFVAQKKELDKIVK